jgi:type II restriction/modification system DNA methylase subunit YeeA
MTPAEFIGKWERSTLKESAAAQQHFLDLCDLLGEPKPAEVDPTGDEFCFEKGATKSTGGQGFADVWKRGCFAWEYKGPHKDLDRAYSQLLRYAGALEHPPLLIVSDTKTIIIRTEWTARVQEKHEIALGDLVDASNRDLLKAAFSDPERLKPRRTRAELTAEAANDFSALAQRLRERGHEPHIVAHFVNRLVFCMFAEDVRLLPNKLFEKALRRAENAPDKAQGYLKGLFAAMKDGGEFGLDDIPWFNGGLFDDDEALPLDHNDVRLVLKAASLYWGDIDPSILGTLFERGLDPSKRSQLGAHYTDREKIMMIVGPVIVEPLTAEWEKARAEIEKHADVAHAAEAKIAAVQEEAARLLKEGDNLAKRGEAARQKLITGERQRATKALNSGQKLLEDFVERLRAFRVLDPACGSGNFLYLSLQALKDLEHRANVEAEAMGLKRLPPRVGPEAVKGIEINPYAAELARVSIWIGEIQWMRKNGFDAARNPILRPLGNIECRDALIEQGPDGVWREAEWPDADVIVGNPPFLGDRKMIRELGEEYVFTLRDLFEGRVPGGADLVCYWFQKAWRTVDIGVSARAGLVATNSIRGGANREVLKPIVAEGRIFSAWSDEPWVVDGAAVRVSLICFEAERAGPRKLDGEPVTEIHSDLSTHSDGTDVTSAGRLTENAGISFIGTQRNGPFTLTGDEARRLLQLPINPNGKPNSVVIRPWTNGIDISRRPSDTWIIDFNKIPQDEAVLFERPFQIVLEDVRPTRINLRRKWHRENWWLFGDPRPALRRAISPLSRFMATVMVSKHRFFVWLPIIQIPENLCVAIARDDDTTFGILHSKFHELWSLRMGTWLGVGNDPRYTPTTCFETFPFPEGLTLDIPAKDYADDPRAMRVAEAARRLNELRENWLNPPDLVKRVPEVVAGYPDRILPVDDKAAQILKKRTLTNLYNERPAWLEGAHRVLDEAVAAAYGWEEDFKAGALTEEEILKRLFELNQQRAKSQ